MSHSGDLLGTEFGSPMHEKISFLSCMNRPLCPLDNPHSRLANAFVQVRGDPNTGPGLYDNNKKTSFIHQLETRIESHEGYTLGARKTSRFKDTSSEIKAVVKDVKSTELYVDRPGTYDHDVPRNRLVHYHQSFGGAPISMPQISIQSTIQRNTVKLHSAKEENKYFRKLAYLKLYY